MTTTVLEWWPDYSGQLLHLRNGPGGASVALDELPLAAKTSAALRRWVGAYADDKLPLDGPGDDAWLAEGIALLAQCRSELRPKFDVVVTEPWWAEPPSG